MRDLRHADAVVPFRTILAARSAGTVFRVAMGRAVFGGNRQARHPRDRATTGCELAVATGQIVPSKGNSQRMIRRVRSSKYNDTWPAIVVAPRFGMAYTHGRQNFVVRGGIGLFHDRPSGDTMYSQIGNPPFSTSRTVRNAVLQQLSSGIEVQGPPTVNSIWPYEGDIPASTQWNVGVQTTLPWASSLDVSYVGLRGFNSA